MMEVKDYDTKYDTKTVHNFNRNYMHSSFVVWISLLLLMLKIDNEDLIVKVMFIITEYVRDHSDYASLWKYITLLLSGKLDDLKHRENDSIKWILQRPTLDDIPTNL